jgi:rhodanese-related sulfurtransferase
MKKYAVLFLLIAALILPGVMVMAQEAAVADAVTERVSEWGSALPQGYGVTRVEDLLVALTERDIVLLDVREPAEYEAGHIEGAFNVPIRTLAQNLNLLPDLNAEIMVICKGGARAAYASAALQFLGYTNVKILAGGNDAWVGEDLPVVTEAFVPEAGAAPEIAPELVEVIDAALSGLPEGFALVSATNLAAELVETTPFLVDVRSNDEFATGTIEGAQHIWINEFAARLDELPEDKDANIVVFCASGYRGGIAAVMLDVLGYTNVRNLSGGTNAWKAASLPIFGAPAEVEAPAAAFEPVAFFTEYVAALPNTFGAVRPADLKAELDGGATPLLVDVRTADEYSEGYIAGAINVPINELIAGLGYMPDLNADIVVYCGSGHRSALAMVALNTLGYTNVRSMISGFGAWTGAGYEASQEPVEAVAGTAPTVDPAALELVSAFMGSIQPGYWTVRPADLNVELVENAPVLIDVRTDGEWADGYIAGAQHIQFADFMTRLAELPQDKAAAIVIYDNPTHRSSMAMAMLRMLGYENVRALGGGFGAWTKAELPVVTD